LQRLSVDDKVAQSFDILAVWTFYIIILIVYKQNYFHVFSVSG